VSDVAADSRRRAPILVGATAALFLVALTTAVVLHGGRPFGWDSAVHEWGLRMRTPAVTTAARWLTATGTGLPAYALAAVAGTLGGGRRRWWAGALLTVAVLAAVQLLRLGVAHVIARPRPPTADWATTASGFSFPSGHATTSGAVAVLLVIAFPRWSTSRSVRVIATTAAAAWAVGVGLTRIYLGVHWPTDVLGGWLLVVALAGLAVGSAPVVLCSRTRTRWRSASTNENTTA